MGIAELLGPAGPVAAALAGYEPRDGQLSMALAVEQCLLRGGISVIEAGTGTGKTLAYLLPALVAAPRARIVISTATRTLQDQIYRRDLPLLMRAIGSERRVALMKGLSNYVCRRRASEFLRSREVDDPRWRTRLPMIEQWLTSTPTGAIDELETLSEDDALWAQLTASSERRIGAGCVYFDECHVTAMRRRAVDADIVVVNHHLFFADLALRGDHPGSVIPDYDAVIFDEAHQLEEIATQYFGVGVSSARVSALCRDARPVLERHLGASSASVADRVEHAARAFFDQLEKVSPGEARRPLQPEHWVGPLSERWFSLDTALEGLVGRVAIDAICRPSDEDDAGADRALGLLTRRAEALREDLSSIARSSPGTVGWFEGAGRGQRLGSSPVNLAHVFQSRLFDVVPSVVLTSATLTSGPTSRERQSDLDDSPDAELAEVKGPFRYFRQRVGLDEATYRVDELTVASPFDFERQALLYLPDDLPAPQSQGFGAAVAERCAALIELSGGGAFVLTTSHRAMTFLHRALESRLPTHPLLMQGQRPKAALLEQFRAAGDAVLVATLSFWQGVDIAGSALRLVILEKAPFPVPSDPLLQARGRALEEEGQAPFTRLHLPLAQLTLKQGFGRLIRSRGDRGVVALLDSRVHSRGYGQRLLEGLPPARRVRALADVAAFWQGE